MNTPWSTRHWIAFFIFCALGWPKECPALTRIWTHHSSQLWSEPDNWSPVGLPQPEDNLIFTDDATFTGPDPVINDLVGVTVNSMEFHIVNGNFGTSDWVLNGNPITLILGIDTDTATADEHVHINCALILGSDIHILVPHSANGDDVVVQLTGAINLNGHNLRLFGAGYESTLLDIAGAIYGTGNVVASGSVVSLSGSQANTFHGTLIVTPGKSDEFGADTFGDVQLNKQSGVAVPERLHVEKSSHVTLLHSEQIADDATVEIVGDVNKLGHSGGGVLLLNGFDETIGNLVMTNYARDTNNQFTSLAHCLVDTGGGTLTLNGDVTARCDTDYANPLIMGRLNLPSTRSFTTRGAGFAGLGVEAQITGAGGLSKDGNSALLLQASNSFSGGVSALQGIVDVRNNRAFGSGNVMLLRPADGVGGSLILRNVAIGNPLYVLGGDQITPEFAGSIVVAFGTCLWLGAIELDTNLVVQADNMTFLGAITGAGGMEFLGGTTFLGGASGNLYTGTTLVRNQLLKFGKPSGVNAYAGPLVVGGGDGGPCEARWLSSYQNVGATATLYANGIINLNEHTEDFGPVTFNGGEVDTGTGTFNIYAPLVVNPSPSSAVINGYLGLPPGDNRLFIVGDGATDCDLLVNAVIFGSPGTYFVKQGTGTMCLAGLNTFDAPTLLEEGIIDINNGSGLGTWPGLVIFDGATLRLSGSGTGGGFEGIGGGVGATHGAIEVPANASWTLAGGVLLDGPITLNVADSGGLGFIGAISSSGPGCSVTKNGTGTLVYSGPANNTYIGDTIINQGGFYLSKSANVAAVPGNLIIGPAPAGPVAFARLLQVGGIWGSTVTVNANALFDLNTYSMSLAQLNLRDGGIVWTSGGTLSFPSGSAINVGSQSLFGSHAASTISGFLSLPLIGAVTFNVSPAAPTPPLLFGSELEVTAAISGGVNHGNTGTLIKEGLGQMRLSGNSTFSGNVNINDGRLIAAHANALGSAFRGTAVNNGAELILEGGINVAGEYITLDSSNSPALESRGGVNTSGGILYLNRNSQFGPTSPADGLVAAGQIAGPGALIKVGGGSLTLGGTDANTFAGETFINEGTLFLNKPFTVTAIPGPLNIGTSAGTAALARNLNGYQIVGNIFVNRNGLYDVNGQEENVDHLWLSEGGDVQTGAGALYLKTGGSVRAFPGAINNPSTISGNLGLDPGQHDIIVGPGVVHGLPGLVIDALVSQPVTTTGIQKSGDGTLLLTANNTYAGSTVVSGGTLQVDGSQPQSDVQINGGTLQGNGTVGIVSFTGSGGVIAPGASPGVLNCQGLVNGGGTGALQMELNGPLPGSGYDQLTVATGVAVNLTGISLKAFLGFASSVGQRFTILNNNNDGILRITGTFTGLPQGRKFYLGQELFQIDYRGGDGNNVVLTRLATPSPPQLAIQRASSNSVRLLWPTNDPPFSLQTATNLPSTNWTAALPLPLVVGTNNVVTNATAGARSLYRLSSP